jgi:hypothetical protein
MKGLFGLLGAGAGSSRDGSGVTIGSEWDELVAVFHVRGGRAIIGEAHGALGAVEGLVLPGCGRLAVGLSPPPLDCLLNAVGAPAGPRLVKMDIHVITANNGEVGTPKSGNS